MVYKYAIWQSWFQELIRSPCFVSADDDSSPTEAMSKKIPGDKVSPKGVTFNDRVSQKHESMYSVTQKYFGKKRSYLHRDAIFLVKTRSYSVTQNFWVKIRSYCVTQNFIG
jgi:hypothetical protein